MINKAEYPRTVTAEQSLLLNYQQNYNSNRNSQSDGVSNQLMFSQRGENGDDEGGPELCMTSIKVVQEHGMKIFFPLHNTVFDSLQKYEKKEAEKAGEEMLYKIQYLEKSDKARFVDL